MVAARQPFRLAIAGHTFRVLHLCFAVALAPAVAAAEGSIKGCVTDNHGGVLPGVAVLASSAGGRGGAVTDSNGCYELQGLVAGTYSVTAALAGFVTGKRERVAVRDGSSTEPLDFTLCTAAFEEIDWPVPPLMEMWQRADVVAEVRITRTTLARSECPSRDFEHQATVIYVFKDSAKRPAGFALTFIQENWTGERTPYSEGENIVVFLSATSRGFRRFAGPHSVFFLRGGRVISSIAEINGITATALRAKLAAFVKRFDGR
jgi:hypothetical protein